MFSISVLAPPQLAGKLYNQNSDKRGKLTKIA